MTVLTPGRHAQETREDHVPSRRPDAVGPPQLSQDFRRADPGVLEAAEEFLLNPRGALRKGGAGLAAALHEQGGREVAHDPGRVRMQRLAVEGGHGNREFGTATPGRQDLGVGREQQAGGREPLIGTALLQAFPERRFESCPPSLEARPPRKVNKSARMT